MTDALAPFLTQRAFLKQLHQQAQQLPPLQQRVIEREARALFHEVELVLPGKGKSEYQLTCTIKGEQQIIRYKRQTGSDLGPMIHRDHLDLFAPKAELQEPEAAPVVTVETKRPETPVSRKELGANWLTHQDLVPMMGAYLKKETGSNAGKTYYVNAAIKSLRSFTTLEDEVHGMRCRKYYSGVRQLGIAIHADDAEKFCTYAYSNMRPLTGLKTADELERRSKNSNEISR